MRARLVPGLRRYRTLAREVRYGERSRVDLLLRGGNSTLAARSVIDVLHDKLTTQIARALQHEARVEGGARLVAPELAAVRRTVGTEVHIVGGGELAG